MTARRHSWSAPERFAHHSDRVCWDCALIKRTRHEGHSHWTEWWRDGARISSDATPPCPGSPDQAALVITPRKQHGAPHATDH
jgi:hypothetical protein